MKTSRGSDVKAGIAERFEAVADQSLRDAAKAFDLRFDDAVVDILRIT